MLLAAGACREDSDVLRCTSGEIVASQSVRVGVGLCGQEGGGRGGGVIIGWNKDLESITSRNWAEAFHIS